jgi:hypothetical protein
MTSTPAFARPVDGARRLLGRVHEDLALQSGRVVAQIARDPRAGHPHPRAGDFAAPDPVAHRQPLAQGAAQVDRRGDAREQELPRRDLHDAVDEVVLRDPGVPAVVVAVAENVQVHVRVDEARQHHAAARVDDLGVRGDRDLGGRPDAHDPVALDEDRGAVHGRDSLVAVEEHPADESEPSSGAAAPAPARAPRPRRRGSASAQQARAKKSPNVHLDTSS